MSNPVCDQCNGSGEQSFYVTDGGEILMGGSNGPFPDLESYNTKMFPCQTCEGTGIMPNWLLEFNMRIK